MGALEKAPINRYNWARTDKHHFEYIWPYYRFTKTAGCGKVRFAYKRPLQRSTLLNQAEHKKR